MTRILEPSTILALLALGALAAGPAAAVELADAEIYIEINDTDGDAGIHLFLDGEGWRRMKLFNPDGQMVGLIKGKGGIGQQGLTELFFESAEPSFDVQPLDEFLALHPEGTYTFTGLTTDGEEIEGEAELTHVLPGAPVLVFPVEEGVDPEDAEFVWQAVADPAGSEIVRYIVIVVCETEDDEFEIEMEVNADTTSVTVAPEFLEQEDWEECKWEVLAREASGNQTISEAEFEVD